MNFVKFNSTLQQAGKNWGSLRGKIFARLLSAPKARQCVAKSFRRLDIKTSKQNNFLSIFCILRAPFFLLKGFENCFALMFGLMPNGGNASHPQPAFGGQSRRAKIPSPRPPSFLPACLGFALKFFERADGGAEIRKEENKAVKTLAPPSHARVFDILLPFSFTILKYFGNIMLWERNIFINKYTTI